MAGLISLRSSTALLVTYTVILLLHRTEGHHDSESDQDLSEVWSIESPEGHFSSGGEWAERMEWHPPPKKHIRVKTITRVVRRHPIGKTVNVYAKHHRVHDHGGFHSIESDHDGHGGYHSSESGHDDHDDDESEEDDHGKSGITINLHKRRRRWKKPTIHLNGWSKHGRLGLRLQINR